MDHHAGTRCVPGRHHPLQFEPDPMVLVIVVQEQLTTRIGPRQGVRHQEIFRPVAIEIGHHRRIPTVGAGQRRALRDVVEGEVAVVVVQQVLIVAEEVLVGDVEVPFPIVVMVDEDGAPPHSNIAHPCGFRDVGERRHRLPRWRPRVEEEVVGEVVGDEQVHVPVVVQIRCVHPHALGLQVQPPLGRLLVEHPCPVVDVELVGLVGVVRQVEVQVTVVLDVDEQGAHADQIVEGARGEIAVGEPTFSIGHPELIGRVHVDHVQVEVTVLIDVGGMRTAALGFSPDAQILGDFGEGPSVVAPETVGVPRIATQQVWVSIVVIIEEQRGHREALVLHARFNSHKHLIAFIAVQRVRREATAHIDIQVAIEVIIRHRQRVVEVIAQDARLDAVVGELSRLRRKRGGQGHEPAEEQGEFQVHGRVGST